MSQLSTKNSFQNNVKTNSFFKLKRELFFLIKNEKIKNNEEVQIEIFQYMCNQNRFIEYYSCQILELKKFFPHTHEFDQMSNCSEVLKFL